MKEAWANGKFDDRDFGEEVKEKIRQATLQQFADKGHPCIGRILSDETKGKIREKRGQQRFEKTSRLEQQFGEWLCEFGLDVTPQKHIAFYRVDFGYEDGEYKFAIEIDGCYFHACPKCYPNGAFGLGEERRRKDLVKTKWLTMKGWIVLRIVEHDIKEYGRFLARTVAQSIVDATKGKIKVNQE